MTPIDFTKPVRLKGLEWVKADHSSDWQAETAFESYYITFTETGIALVITEGPQTEISDHKSIRNAKRAATTKYHSRLAPMFTQGER